MQIQQRVRSDSGLSRGLRWALVAGLTILSPKAQSKSISSRKPESKPQDSIDVVDRIPLPAGSIAELVPTRHFSSDYLYPEYNTGGKVIIMDVTNPSQPSIVANLAHPVAGPGSGIIAAAGTSAVAISKAPASVQVKPPQSVEIISFARY